MIWCRGATNGQDVPFRVPDTVMTQHRQQLAGLSRPAPDTPAVANHDPLDLVDRAVGPALEAGRLGLAVLSNTFVLTDSVRAYRF
jgi:hypothetical protein